MKTQSIVLAALAAAPSALAHTVWSTFYIDGVSQGDGVAMRMRTDPAKASFPLEDYSSTDMACNVDGTTGVPRVQSVPDGSTLTFEMRSWPNDASKESLDEGHKGPCAVYLKKVDSAVDDKAAGDGWFKVFDHGYDSSSDQWCTDRLIANKGRLSVKLPKGLQGGYYLARPEVVALHNATDGGAQFYMGCAQVFLESSGALIPEETVSIPGYVQAGEPSVKFNIYVNKNAEYKIPGPPVAKLTSSSGVAAAGTAQTAQTEGLRPDDAIAENANWFGTEVPSYSDESGCWASGEKCWKQLDACYKAAPPTGNKGCEIWQKKCQGINDACEAKNFDGPPNKGVDLTPKAETIDVGLVMATVGGGVDASAPKTTAAAKEDKPKSTAAAATTTKEEVPLSTVSGATSTTAAAPSSKVPAPSKSEPTAASSSKGYAYGGADAEGDKTKTTITVPASEKAPAPTEPAKCPEGFECHTVVEMEYVTVTEYVTLGSQRRRSMHWRRHGGAF
ncbi:lytic polysaccharide monooxygenase [Lentithecium fluviatile CBS 122367]|uniref:AA9 family lytic polysaccharide monooxygenase n=1 Tax=Lentithecium fluviatile CBS 122367 TaxID=1168545 RepID=A0A6G1JCB0_9PLEO|nr:lytic polysaccharide monooxygenase [Lentithecium fluviatile CBS 122367]